jgi:hypothetical protein
LLSITFARGRGLGVLHRRLLARLRLEAALLNLLFLQRQRVLHRVGLRLRFEHRHLRPRLRLLDVTRLLGFGLELRGSNHLLLDLHLDRQPIVFLRLEQ